MKITVCDICGREGADVDTNCFTLPMADETDAFYFSNAHLPYAAEICEDCQDAIQNLINEQRSKLLEEKRMERKINCKNCPICDEYSGELGKIGFPEEVKV